MHKNNIEIIKKLREKTGLGILDCKEILLKSNFNFSLALNNSFELNKIKAEKKSSNIIKKGKIFSKISNDFKYGILLEINSETDLIHNNNEFNSFCKEIVNYSSLNKIMDFNYIKDFFYKDLINLISKFNENIKFGKFGIMSGDFIYSYIHMNKIGTIISSSEKSKLDVLKHIAMNIIFYKPKYIYTKDISKNIIKNEYKIQLEIIRKLNDNKKIINKIIKEKIKNFINKNTLINQKSIIDENKYIIDILKDNEIKLNNFKIIEISK